MINFRTLVAAALVSGSALSQASEITDFPSAERESSVSREQVRAEAEAANRAGALRYDFIGPAQEPMSMQDRGAVRDDAASRRSAAVAPRNVGGQ